MRGSATAVSVGRLTEQRYNRCGLLLANALCVAGAPLPISNDIDVPSIVTVTEDVTTGGQVWTRLYANRTGFPQIIHSAKRFCGPTGLEEYIRFSITIALRISVEDGALVFRDDAYSTDAGPLRLTLPRFLAPGRLTIQHQETQRGRFRFSMQLAHPLFGELLYQRRGFTERSAHEPGLPV